jgi:hypothetical protein
MKRHRNISVTTTRPTACEVNWVGDPEPAVAGTLARWVRRRQGIFCGERVRTTSHLKREPDLTNRLRFATFRAQCPKRLLLTACFKLLLNDSHTLEDAGSILSNLDNQNALVLGGPVGVSALDDSQLGNCALGAAMATQTPKVAPVGDSRAEVWTAALAKKAMLLGLRVTSYLQSACPMSADDDLKSDLATPPIVIDRCRILRDAPVNRLARDPKIRAVITAGFFRSRQPQFEPPTNSPEFVSSTRPRKVDLRWR